MFFIFQCSEGTNMNFTFAVVTSFWIFALPDDYQIWPKHVGMRLELYALPTQLYLCVLCGSENKQVHYSYTYLYITDILHFTLQFTFQFTLQFTHDFNNLNLHLLFAPSSFRHLPTKATCYNIRWFKELSTFERTSARATKATTCRKFFTSVIKQLGAQKFCFTISLFHACTCFEHMCWYHHTYRCDDTRGCVMQFWPPGDEHMLLETCRGMK